MVNKFDNVICKEAELYYLSKIYGESYGVIPGHIADHLESCGYCREQVACLRSELESGGKGNRVEIERIYEGRQFAQNREAYYGGKEIFCKDVKRFLPMLVDEQLFASVPAAIMVHLESCEQCQKDFCAIKALGLEKRQLRILSEIMSCECSGEYEDSDAFAEAIQSYVDFDFSVMEGSVLKHLCYCGACQLLIYKVRAKRIETLEPKEQESFLCGSNSFCKLFDFCFPYELGDKRKVDDEISNALAEHVRECPACLGKIQQLGQAIFKIKQRGESGVVTVYEGGDNAEFISGMETEPSDKVAAASESRSDENGGSGIVEIAGFRPALMRKGLKYVSRGLVAAVLILGVFFLLEGTPKAAASTLEQVYKALEKVSNVYIRKFWTEDEVCIQETLVLKNRSIYAVQDRNGSCLWDFEKGRKTIKTDDESELQDIQLNDGEISIFKERKINGAFGLLPFDDISQLPESAVWKDVSNENSGPSEVSGDCEIYELLWLKQTTSVDKLGRKWRIFIDPRTQRPLRTEFYEQRRDLNYELLMTQTISYPSDEIAVGLAETFLR